MKDFYEWVSDEHPQLYLEVWPAVMAALRSAGPAVVKYIQQNPQVIAQAAQMLQQPGGEQQQQQQMQQQATLPQQPQTGQQKQGVMNWFMGRLKDPQFQQKFAALLGDIAGSGQPTDQ
jgi:predicted helicase